MFTFETSSCKWKNAVWWLFVLATQYIILLLENYHLSGCRHPCTHSEHLLCPGHFQNQLLVTFFDYKPLKVQRRGKVPVLTTFNWHRDTEAMFRESQGKSLGFWHFHYAAFWFCFLTCLRRVNIKSGKSRKDKGTMSPGCWLLRTEEW
jgi:hypothetical protein